MGALYFGGRLLFVSIFLLSSCSHLEELVNGKTDTIDNMMVPKFEMLFQTIGIPASVLPIPLATLCLYLYYASTFLGLMGSILVLLNIRFGGYLLSLFLVGVTPVIHNFWDMEGKEFFVEFIMFLKNTSLMGACLMFSGQPKAAKGKRKPD